MQPSWQLPAEVEKPFRDGLDHAAKRRIDELHGMLEQMSQEQLAGAVSLCGFVTAYTAINAVSRKWPTDHGLRVLAQKTVEGGTNSAEFGVTEENVYRFVSECALGFKPYDEVFGEIFPNPKDFFAAPFFITVNVLATFVPKGQSIWKFLDQIETAYEGAWLLDLNFLPALMVRARMPQTDHASDAKA